MKIILNVICFSLILPFTIIANPADQFEGVSDKTAGFGSGTKGTGTTGFMVQDDSIQFTYPISTTVVRRKNPIIIRWKGLQEGTVYFLELYKNGIYHEQIAEIVDIDQYAWQVSKEFNGGKDYQLRLVNSRFFGDYTFSETFRIKNRIPRAFWVLPAAAGAAGIYFLIKIIFEGGPDDVDDLPSPIEPN